MHVKKVERVHMHMHESMCTYACMYMHACTYACLVDAFIFSCQVDAGDTEAQLASICHIVNLNDSARPTT